MPGFDFAALGKAVATARHQRGWSLRQMQAATGIPHMQVKRMEDGIPVGIGTILKACAFLGVDVDDFVRGEPANNFEPGDLPYSQDPIDETEEADPDFCETPI